MPRPKSVTIAGTKMEDVLGMTLSIDTPVGPRGDYEGRTIAATVQVIRRARNTPTSAMFKNATNEDGRFNCINGTIVLENSKRTETYTIEMNEAYICAWQFVQPPDDDFLNEVITLKVGDLKLSGGGGSKAFKVPEFNRGMN